MKLSKLLTEVPEDLFWTERRGEAVPHFNRIFAEVLRRSLDLVDFSDRIPLHAVFTAEVPNLSSFQRAVAKEASRRREAGIPEEEPESSSMPAPEVVASQTEAEATENSEEAPTKASAPGEVQTLFDWDR